MPIMRARVCERTGTCGCATASIFFRVVQAHRHFSTGCAQPVLKFKHPGTMQTKQ